MASKRPHCKIKVLEMSDNGKYVKTIDCKEKEVQPKPNKLI